MYRLICCIGFCFSVLLAYSKDTLDFQQAETVTYRLFTTQKWDSLILIGNEAIHQQIDYHFLRVRIGIAYFEKKKYREATVHLQKALEYNSSNETAKEYLYLSLLYSEQYEAAGKISYRFDDSTTAKMKTNHHPLIDLVGAEGGEKICSDSIYGNALFADIVLSHRIGKAISFTHAIGYYNQSYSHHEKLPPYLVTETDNGKISQWEYYLGSNIPFAKSWLISPAVHFIFLDTRIRTVIPFLDAAIKTPFLDTTIHTTATQTIASLSLKKSFAYFDAGIGGSWSNLYGADHIQESISMNGYPFGNNKLVLGVSLFLNQDSLQTATHFSWSASASYSFLKRVKICAMYYMGSSKFVNEYNGFLVNNCPDLTTSKITFSPTVTISRHIALYGLVQYEEKNHKNYLKPDTNFHYTTLLAGIKLIL